MKKLIPALALLVVSAVLMGTSTFAWFSLNNKVTVTGMTVTTKVGSNLLISDDNAASGATYGNAKHTVVSGRLEPVSTINGENFFYTRSSNVDAVGDAKTDAYIAYAEGEDFDANYGLPSDNSSADAYGYKDYSFYLKATNAESTNQKLAMSACNLLYNGAALGADKAWRVALFAVETTAGATVADNTAAVAANLKTILAPDSAAYFTPTQAVKDDDELANLAVTLNTAATIATLTPAQTKYYKVVVRLWLEGEDTTCTNATFAELTGDWSLDLAFQIQAGDGVTLIGSTANATLTAPANVATAALTVAGETASTYEFFNASSGASLGSASATATYTNEDTENAIDVYCVIVTTKGNNYRTPAVTVAKKTA